MVVMLFNGHLIKAIRLDGVDFKITENATSRYPLNITGLPLGTHYRIH